MSRGWVLVLVVFGLGQAQLGPASARPAQPAPTVVATLEGPADLVDVAGTLLFVLADRALRIFDVRVPSSPRLVGSFEFPERVSMFAASETVVYAVAVGFGLRTLDISDPAAPVLRGAIKLPGDTLDIVLWKPDVLLLTNYSTAFTIIDVTDIAAPTRLSSVITDGYAIGVAASSAFAYVSDLPTGLYVFDLTTPESPVEVKLLPLKTMTRPGLHLAFDIALVRLPEREGSAVVAVLDDAGGLELFDVSTPATATPVADARVPLTPSSLGRFPRLRMKVRGSAVYVAAGVQGIHAIDLAVPTQPRITSFNAPAPAHDLAFLDTFVYVAAGEGGVIVLGSG